MFFRKYKILGSSLIVAACISIGFPSQASMTPMQNKLYFKGLKSTSTTRNKCCYCFKN